MAREGKGRWRRGREGHDATAPGGGSGGGQRLLVWIWALRAGPWREAQRAWLCRCAWLGLLLVLAVWRRRQPQQQRRVLLRCPWTCQQYQMGLFCSPRLAMRVGWGGILQ